MKTKNKEAKKKTGRLLIGGRSRSNRDRRILSACGRGLRMMSKSIEANRNRALHQSKDIVSFDSGLFKNGFLSFFSLFFLQCRPNR